MILSILCLDSFPYFSDSISTTIQSNYVKSKASDVHLPRDVDSVSDLYVAGFDPHGFGSSTLVGYGTTRSSCEQQARLALLPLRNKLGKP